MMGFRKIGIVGALALTVWTVSPAPLSAQLLGQVSTASTMEANANDVGGYIGLLDHATALFGQYRRRFTGNGDFGVQFGLIDYERANARLMLGGDAKFQVMNAASNDPFDLAFDSRLMFVDYHESSLLSIGESVVLSHDYQVSNGSTLSPYGAVNLRLDHLSSHTDWQVAAVGGVKWELSDLMDALGEVVFDNEMGIVLGLNFKL